MFITFSISCNAENNKYKDKSEMSDNIKIATFGAGCFWCTEAVFKRVKGVESVTSGYSGGKTKNPTYEAVTSGNTGHAEVIQIKFNPDIIKYDELLEIFFKTHDPTTLNRQGADIGTQYRSVIFYSDETQREKAKYWINKLNNADIFENSIVTEVSPLEKFYPAELYHQDYYDNNMTQPYCNFVITPKINKLEELFESKLK